MTAVSADLMDRPALADLLARVRQRDAAFTPEETQWLMHHRIAQYAGAAPPRVLARNRRLLRETLRVDGLLKDHGIEPLHVKGATLALRLDGNLKGRQFTDVDLIVRPEEALPAAALLEADGFRPVVPYREQPDRLLKRHFEMRHIHPDGRVVEIHWRLHPPWLPVADIDEVATTTMQVQGQALRVLPPVDNLEQVILHGFRSHWRRMGWLLDGARLSLRGIPVRPRFEEHGLERVHDLFQHLMQWCVHGEPAAADTGRSGRRIHQLAGAVEQTWLAPDAAGMHGFDEMTWMARTLGARRTPGMVARRLRPGPTEQGTNPLPPWARGAHWVTRAGRWARYAVKR